MELFVQADIAHDLKYISDEMFNQIEEQVESISKMIQAMCYLRKSSSAKK